MQEPSVVLYEIEDLIRRFFHRRKRRKIVFTFSTKQFSVTGDDMNFTMLQTQSVNVLGSPVDANNNPSLAQLSNISYSSSDPTVFTVAADPNTPGGAIIQGVGPGTATLTELATATETSGAVEQISGTATITISASGNVPVGVAASISFAFGTPVTTGQALP
jgi:hypothetical protein